MEHDRGASARGIGCRREAVELGSRHSRNRALGAREPDDPAHDSEHNRAAILVDTARRSHVMAPVRAVSIGLVACRICGLVMRRIPSPGLPAACSRCTGLLRDRLPWSAEHTLAWLI